MKRAIIAGVIVCAFSLGGYLWWRAVQPPHLLGCIPSEIDWRSVSIAQAPSDVELPARVDWRGEFTPGNQGRQASCVGWAASAAIGKALSPAFIYNQRTTSNCKRDAGMSLYNALAILKGRGVCLEILNLYDAGNACTQPDPAAIADAERRKVSGYSVVFAQPGDASLDVLRGFIAAGRPVLVAVPVYSSFFDNAMATIPQHVDGERFYGGHAMLLVGYDSGGFWALNSWGVGWGWQGFAYLSNEFVQADAWEGWIMDGLVGATQYSAYVNGLCIDADTGAPLAGVTVRLGTRSSTTNATGKWGQTFSLAPGQQYTLEITAPTGYWLPGGAVFKAPAGAVTTLTVETFKFRRQGATTPTVTVAPTWTATPTLPMPPGTPTPEGVAPLWALLSAFGDWKLVGDMPGGGRLAGLSYLSIPEEHYELIRRQTYAALGSPLPAYDTWERTPFGVALRLTGVDVLTPVVIVTDEGGAAIYRAVRTTGGILVMRP